MQILVLYVESVWKLRRPNLMLSITGGAKDFPMGDEREKVLRQLMETAQYSNAWIITGGTNVGIMKYVGNHFFTANVFKTIQIPDL